MADYDSSLPVRTENAGDVIAKIADANTPSQQLAIDVSGKITTKLNDGSGNSLSSTGGALHIADGGGSITVDGSVTVTATQLDIDDLNATDDAVSAWLKDEAGNAFSSGNPLPVEIISSTSGTEVNAYDTQATLAAAASDNHDYTVSGTMIFKGVWATASGKLKVEVQIDPDGLSGYSTKYVGFNSTANPNIDLKFSQSLELANGALVRVIRTNLDKASMDVYSTIEGLLI
jgi:hypothetical protein